MVAPLITDPIADLIIRLKNAVMASHTEVKIPYSSMKENIARKLSEKGFIENVKIRGEGVEKHICVSLVYTKKQKKPIRNVKRVSKPGRRMYAHAKDIYPYKGGYGTSLISTPQGILFDYEARKNNVGGEILFHIW